MTKPFHTEHVIKPVRGFEDFVYGSRRIVADIRADEIAGGRVRVEHDLAAVSGEFRDVEIELQVSGWKSRERIAGESFRTARLGTQRQRHEFAFTPTALADGKDIQDGEMLKPGPGADISGIAGKELRGELRGVAVSGKRAAFANEAPGEYDFGYALGVLGEEETVCGLRGAGHNLLVTGGVSSEPPTDAYDLFNYVWHCEKLYRQLEEWAIADNAKRTAERERLTNAGKPETAAPGNDMIRQYVERKVDEWLNDGPEEVLRALTFWAHKPPGITPRLELGDVRELLEELAEFYGDDGV